MNSKILVFDNNTICKPRQGLNPNNIDMSREESIESLQHYDIQVNNPYLKTSTLKFNRIRVNFH